MRRSFRIHRGKILANEEPVVRQITDGLTLSRLPWYRVRERLPGDCAPSMPGIPDIGGWVPPKFWGAITAHAMPYYVEVKRQGSHRKRAAQVEFIERAKADGCIAFFAQGWNDVVEEFEQYGIALPH